MKKALLSLALLFALLLTSCAGAPPEVTTTAQPEETTTEAEVGSIVFQGERITAPGEYAGVPKEYYPILDTRYLENELNRRWTVLNCEDTATEEIDKEYYGLDSKLDERGYEASMHDNVETSGYALADLDGDKIPELLLLCKASDEYELIQNPAVTAIFTVRGGKALQIGTTLFDDVFGAFRAMANHFFGDIIVTADGAIHQFVRSYPSLSLRSWRLEQGKEECTPVSEILTDISIEKGEAAVQYWATKENGKETRIREKEYNTLYEKITNPQNLLKTKFIPLHPGAKNPVHIEKPTEAPRYPSLPASEKLPKSYPDAPQAYREILDGLYLWAVCARNGTDPIDLGDLGTKIGFSEQLNSDGGDFAYAVADINRDGTPELLLGGTIGLADSAFSSLFTLKDGKPISLVTYTYRNGHQIAADGTIYRSFTGSASTEIRESLRLEKNGDSLEQLVWMVSAIGAGGETYYAKEIDDKREYTREKEYLAFDKICLNPPKGMKLTVHSILDD